MILSRDRILATHVGSLPRNETLSEMLIDREEGKPLSEEQLASEMDRAVRHVIAKQAEAGIDIGNESHYVAVPPDRDSQPVRRFGCTTAELRAMADWLN